MAGGAAGTLARNAIDDERSTFEGVAKNALIGGVAEVALGSIGSTLFKGTDDIASGLIKEVDETSKLVSGVGNLLSSGSDDVASGIARSSDEIGSTIGRTSDSIGDEAAGLTGRTFDDAGELPRYDTPYKPLGKNQVKEYNEKLANRTLTQDEYKHLDWHNRFKNRRNRAVDRFWSNERRSLRAGESGTRNWSASQRDTILNSRRAPQFNGQPLEGHHRYNALDHPQIADRPEYIYPVTKDEHLHRWHGGNWQNDTFGKPLSPSYPEDF